MSGGEPLVEKALIGRMKTIAAVDLFAGPGGLNEGFGRYIGSNVRFDVRLSVEKDPVACRTLKLRAFFRQFQDRQLPEAYYDYIRGDASKLGDLRALPEWQTAERHVRQWNLGSQEGGEGYVSPQELHTAINDALRDAGNQWVLLGGPPCQAYSLIGRARMTGVGAEVRHANDPKKTARSRKKLELAFAEDHRHTLYREYLRVVAVHQPAAFVMENVKGILSARLPTSDAPNDEKIRSPKVFDQIQKDLHDPWSALALDPDFDSLKELSQQFKQSSHTYKLYSFVEKADDAWAGLEGSKFVIKAENFGVPQTRHRVIVLGVRDDITRTHVPLQRAREPLTVRNAIEGMPAIRSGISRKDRKTIRKYGADSALSWHSTLSKEIDAIIETSKDSDIIAALTSASKGAKGVTERGGAFMQAQPALGRLSKDLRTFMQDHHIGGVIQHTSRSHMASDLGRYVFLAAITNKAEPAEQQSPTLRELPTSLLPKHANVRNVGRKRIIGGFTDRFRVQAWDRPSSTIMSHLQKDGHYFIHPDSKQCRCLTVREAARLQTFPENYYFEGNTTQQFLQVGNAVPPYLALQLARSVASLFDS
jgi:DNA (cytosine-5)-methyltransferase 1